MSQKILEEMNMSEPMIQSRGLYVIYKGKEGAENVVALRGLNLTIDTGEFVSVVGPSGSGKSSLLRCVGGLQHPSAGSIKYFGDEITKLTENELVPLRREMIGFVFQEGNLLETYSAYQNVVRTLRYAGVGYTESRQRAGEVLGMLGLKSRMHDLPHRLSGGERQRVAIARALANQPKFVLADEPTGNIDYDNTENVMQIFKDLHNELETSFLVVTHSKHVASYSERMLELRDGRFTGQHAESKDLEDLSSSRAVIINPDGSMTLPPELLGVVEEFGNLWEFKLEFDDQQPKIIGFVSEKEDLQLPTECPVCSSSVSANVFYCKNCGAKVR